MWADTRGASYPAGNGARWIATADFNLDGRLDLAVANYDAATVSVFVGVGNGSFQSQLTFPCNAQPRALAIADFNTDGKPDIVTANENGDFVTLLLNTSQ